MPRNGWTSAKRGAFLDELAASCNVTRAAAAAGMGRDAAYGLRRRDPVFAEAWAAAIEQGAPGMPATGAEQREAQPAERPEQQA